jgi:SHS2 domain-containing protein
MTSIFKFIDHTADIAVEAAGSTYEELFLAALEGWKDSIIDQKDNETGIEIKAINFEEESVEELLVSFLQEFNYLFESKRIFPIKVNELKIIDYKNVFQLESNIAFCKISDTDNIKNEIKAVTFHQLDIKKEDDLYKTIIVFDI